VNVLHIGTTLDSKTPATVQVMENGEYLVNIMPIHEEMGIFSEIKLSQIHTVKNVPTTQGKWSWLLSSYIPGSYIAAGNPCWIYSPDNYSRSHDIRNIKSKKFLRN
jgi:hypothetical protein